MLSQKGLLRVTIIVSKLIITIINEKSHRGTMQKSDIGAYRRLGHQTFSDFQAFRLNSPSRVLYDIALHGMALQGTVRYLQIINGYSIVLC